MDIILRQEQPLDYCETENVTREAFWNEYCPGCNEHYLVHIIRDCTAFLPELDIVAVYEGKIVGNVICLKAVVKLDNGDACEVLGLGPISVLPKYQHKGIGSKMLEHVKTLARELGYRAIFLYGDPDYYSQRGFVSAESLGIRTADNMYAAALQVCELYENALSGIRGRYIEDEIYTVDNSSAIEFDRNFPVKEKVSGTPSQKRFEQIVSMRRKAD